MTGNMYMMEVFYISLYGLIILNSEILMTSLIISSQWAIHTLTVQLCLQTVSGQTLFSSLLDVVISHHFKNAY